jgi:hypothetical protein
MDVAITGVTTFEPTRVIAACGQAVEVSAVPLQPNRRGHGSARPGASRAPRPRLDVTGPNGALPRVDDLVVGNVTDAFLCDMLAQADVRDHGAKGSGTADDAPAFAAADAGRGRPGGDAGPPGLQGRRQGHGKGRGPQG